MDYDKFMKIQIADTGKVNVDDSSALITPIDYIILPTISIQDEENVLINEQSGYREENFVFDYQTNTRNGIQPTRFTIRGVLKDTDTSLISTLKIMRRRNTIKKIKGAMNIISQDPDLVTEGDDSFLYVQITNITFTENTGNPDTTNYTIQAQSVNQ